MKDIKPQITDKYISDLLQIIPDGYRGFACRNQFAYAHSMYSEENREGVFEAWKDCFRFLLDDFICESGDELIVILSQNAKEIFLGKSAMTWSSRKELKELITVTANGSTNPLNLSKDKLQVFTQTLVDAVSITEQLPVYSVIVASNVYQFCPKIPQRRSIAEKNLRFVHVQDRYVSEFANMLDFILLGIFDEENAKSLAITDIGNGCVEVKTESKCAVVNMVTGETKYKSGSAKFNFDAVTLSLQYRVRVLLKGLSDIHKDNIHKIVVKRAYTEKGYHSLNMKECCAMYCTEKSLLGELNLYFYF